MSRKSLVPIVLPVDPAAAMEAATKQYVDAKAGGWTQGIIDNVTDWDTLRTPGMYSARDFTYNAALHHPPAVGNYGVVSVFVGAWDPAYGMRVGIQVFIGVSGTAETYWRTGNAVTSSATPITWNSTWQIVGTYNQFSDISSAADWDFVRGTGQRGTPAIGAGNSTARHAPVDAETNAGLLYLMDNYDRTTGTRTGMMQMWVSTFGGSSVVWVRSAGSVTSYAGIPWTKTSGGDEIFVGPSDPGTGYEMWYDSDAPGPSVTGVGLPNGGLPGQVLMKKTATDFDAAWISMPAGRNMLDNGAMNVFQRNERTFTGITGSTFCVDRWQLLINAIGTWTIAQVADVPAGIGLVNSVRHTATTAKSSLAVGDYCLFLQNLEGQNIQHLLWGTANARPLTLSFWVRSSVTGTYIAELYRGEATARHISATYTINTANTWEYKTITFPGDQVTVPTNDTLARLNCQLWVAAGTTYTSGTLQTAWGNLNQANRCVGQVNAAATTNNIIAFTGVQLEIGSVASPLEVRSFGDDLAKCQRYSFYPGMGTGTTDYVFCGFGQGTSATGVTATLQFPVTMRRFPALDMNGAAIGSYACHDRIGAASNATNIAADVVWTYSGAAVSITVASGITAGRPYHFLKNSGQTGGLGWTADI